MRLTKSVALYLSLLGPMIGQPVPTQAQSTQPAIFVANNGNCEGSVTSFTLNPDGTLNFVQKLVVEAITCGTWAPGLNCQAIDISPNGKWLVTGHGTAAGLTEQMTFYEIHPDATMSIKLITTTPDSPGDVEWIDDEYLAVTSTPSGSDFVIIYKFNPDTPSCVQHYYQPVSSLWEFVVDREHGFIHARDGLSAVTVFKINPNKTISKVNTTPYPIGVFYLGPGISPDGTKLYCGGGISGNDHAIGGAFVDTTTGALTPMPGAPFTSSGDSPKEIDVSSDGLFAFANHGGDGDVISFTIDQATGQLTQIPGALIDIGSQGDTGAMTVMGNRLFVTRKYSSTQYGPSGVLSMTINKDGTLTVDDDQSTTGSLPWEVVTWPGTKPLCPADLTGNLIVDVDDLLIVINNWGGNKQGDVTGNGIVDVDDLLEIINAWGPCS
jgi:6-phosphogluconolactonase (cycloisomerase 2 family)